GSPAASVMDVASDSISALSTDIIQLMRKTLRDQPMLGAAVPLELCLGPLAPSFRGDANGIEPGISRFRVRATRAPERRSAEGQCLRPLPLPHQIRKAVEQIMGVARTGGGFRVVLHREHRLALERDAAI